MPRIDIVKDREKLRPRREPYWNRLASGCYLGFRKMSADSEGTWIARFRDPESGNRTKRSFGELTEKQPSERYDVARKMAEEWFAHLGKGGAFETVTVGDVCVRYVERLRAAKRSAAAADAEARFARWVHGDKLGGIEIQKLKPQHVQAWRDRLAATNAIPQDKRKKSDRPRANSSLNRDMSTLRAALNLALEDGFVTTDAAWKSKLKPVKDADGRRDVYLDVEQRRALIASALPDLQRFIRALCLVPLRPGAMAALKVSDFDKRLRTLRIGQDKAGKDRKITLPESTASFFAELCRDRIGAAPLVVRGDGRAWNKDAWKGPFKGAVVAAGLPVGATAYALRHSTITDLIALQRLDTMTVAQLSGTSLLMIERHYGHLLRDHAERALDALAVV